VALANKCADRDFYRSLGLGRGLFFDRETFGADKLLVAGGEASWTQLLAQSPLSPQAQSDIARIEEAKIDYLPGLSSAEKKSRLSKMSYRDFLLNVTKADPGAIAFYQARTHGEWGVGIDAVSALDVWAFGFPGFQGLEIAPGSAPGMGYTAAGYADGASYTFHFPDGNASIARLLVRSLVPESLPGRSAEDVVSARLDYSRLDDPRSPARIRLGSTAVRVRNVGDPASSAEVEIVYVRGGEPYAVRAGSCVLACYNMIIPYLCPELPEPQKEALRYAVKVRSSTRAWPCRTGRPSRPWASRGSIRPVHIFPRSSSIRSSISESIAARVPPPNRCWSRWRARRLRPACPSAISTGQGSSIS
jgi:spermidine dehydrogenase